MVSNNSGDSNLGVAKGYILIDASKAVQSIAQLERDINTMVTNVGRRVENAGQQVSNIGANITALTAPLAVGIGVSVKAAIDFEKAFTGVSKTIDGTPEQIDELERSLRELATTGATSSLPNSHIELANIAAAAGQLGVAVEDVDAFTETIAMLAMSTDIVGEEGARALAQFTNITGFPTSDVQRLGDVIADLGNNSATTEAQILEMASRFANLASAGFESDELLAYAAAISSTGINAELGGTNFAKGVNEMILAADRGGPELEVLAAIAGTTTSEFSELANSDPSAALNAFIFGLSGLDTAAQVTALEDVNLKGMEAQRVFLNLAANTDLMSGSLDIASTAIAGNGALMEEASRAAETTAGRMQTLKNNAKDVGITLGESLLPPLNDLIDRLLPVVNRVSEWVTQNPELTSTLMQVGLVIAGLGPVLVIVGQAITAIGAIIAALASPVGLVLLAVGALALAWQTNFLGIQESTAQAWAVIQPILQQAWVALQQIWIMAQPYLQQLVNWFTQTLAPEVQRIINDVVIPAVTGLIDFFVGMWKVAEPGFTAFVNGAKEKFNAFKTNVIDPALKWIDNLIDKIQGLLDKFALAETAANRVSTLGQQAQALGNAVQQQGGGNFVRLATNAVSWGGRSNDSGGSAPGGVPTLVGAGAQPELFLPQTNMTAIPNIDKVLEGIARNGGGSGEQVIYNITVPPGTADPDAFGRAVGDAIELQRETARKGLD